jgi:hypothetical protein
VVVAVPLVAEAPEAAGSSKSRLKVILNEANFAKSESGLIWLFPYTNRYFKRLSRYLSILDGFV